MDPIFAQLIATAGPQVVAFLIQGLQTIKDEQPDSITSEQWDQLRSMFNETYEQRRARIASTIPG